MTPYLRADGPIHGRVPRIETAPTYRVPRPDVPRPDLRWQRRAVCRDEDPELFWPIGNTGPALLQIEDAKQVCSRCPVRDQCLQWAMETGQDYGVVGGMSEDERRSLKRRIARVRAKEDQAAA